MQVIGVLICLFIVSTYGGSITGDIPWTIQTTATSAEVVPYGSGGAAGGSCDIVMSYNGDHLNPRVYGTITCTGLSGTPNAAHIHGTSSEMCGNNAPGTLVATLTPLPAFNNTIDLTLDYLYGGYSYVNIHTPSFPAGEVRANLVNIFGTWATGLNATQRLGNTFLYAPPVQPPTSNYRFSFSAPWSCAGGNVPTAICSGFFDYYESSDDVYLNGQCLNFPGNITQIYALSTDGSGYTITWLYDTDSYCQANNRFQYSAGVSNSPLDSLCAPVNTPPTGWNFTILNDRGDILTCLYTVPAPGCPPTYQSSPVPPFGGYVPPPGTLPPTTGGGPTPTGSAPTPTATAPYPTVVAPTTVPTAGFNLPVTLLFTSFFAILLSLWLN